MTGRVAFVVTGLTKEYGGNPVLEDASVSLHEGAKVGVIGRNGAGKSTFVRLILGQEEAERGKIVVADGLRVGYLEQHDPYRMDETAHEFLVRHSGAEGWKCAETAAKLGLGPAHLAAKIAELPGGYRTRLKLAAMLVKEPDYLVLDEPTNFLDLATVLLLQEFLANFRGGLLLVSHDREFLKRTCDHTLHVERAKLTLYPGDVEEFFAWQSEQLEVARRTNAAIEAKRVHLQAFVDRFKAKASKATQAQSKMKEISRLRPVEVANPLSTVQVRIPPVPEKKGLALAAEEVTLGYASGGARKVIAKDVTFVVDRGAKIAIVGDNGQGKTTLLRTIAGDLEPLAGTVRRSQGIELSVYAQHVYQSLHPGDTVRAHLEREAARDVTRQDVMDMAGAFLFKGDDVEKEIRVLSGGERARLVLSGLLLAKRPVLLLDEPTNHLDFETVEALGDALRRFAGTVVFISHDRTFVNMVASQVVEVGDGRVRVLSGDYADYVVGLEQRARDAQSVKRPAASAESAEDRAAAHAERKRKKNERDRVEKQIREVEARMARCEEERKTLHAAIERDALTHGAAHGSSHYARLGEVDAAHAAAEEEWLALSARREELAE
ncbi:MAG: putative ABC transporter ATP-binding protein YheS [Planctomycetes bacterium]|nr:putative ABC transporter ATP-binding protein YheS [Planctomycetota bacterium]